MSSDDSINIVCQTVRDRRFLPGGGAVELELARRLHQFAEKRAGLEQYAINSFGDALEVIPRTLAENAGLNSTLPTRKATSRTEWTLRMVELRTSAPITSWTIWVPRALLLVLLSTLQPPSSVWTPLSWPNLLEVPRCPNKTLIGMMQTSTKHSLLGCFLPSTVLC